MALLNSASTCRPYSTTAAVQGEGAYATATTTAPAAAYGVISKAAVSSKKHIQLPKEQQLPGCIITPLTAIDRKYIGLV
jgi:hypothetical protein